MGMFSDHPDPVNPEYIAWSTKEAALLPIYLGGTVLMLLWVFNGVVNGLPAAVLVGSGAVLYLIWRTFRAYEQHRDLKRLQKMHDRGWL